MRKARRYHRECKEHGNAADRVGSHGDCRRTPFPALRFQAASGFHRTKRQHQVNTILVKRLSFASIVLFGGFFATDSELLAITLNDTARFLAGKGIVSETKLAAYTRSRFYVQYAEQMKVGWGRFQQPNIERMKTWWEKYAPAAYSTVFYPFSGPDIANTLAFFPEADTYLMFGLEPPGVIPDPLAMQNEKISDGLNGLRASLNTIFQVNFFITRGMEKKLGRRSFNSITGLIMFFLAMNDCEVIGAKRIAIGPDVALVPGAAADDSINWQNPPLSRIPGVEITFRKNLGKIQTIRYFMLNVSDRSLAKNSPNFIPYLKSTGRYVTLIKSASYLMHTDSAKEQPPHFDKIRELVLAQSDFIVQDDSGVPLRFFARDRWRLLFHGRYDAPIQLFWNRRQKDLKAEMQKNSTGRLPFSYGYDYKPGKSNLMTAERITDDGT